MFEGDSLARRAGDSSEEPAQPIHFDMASEIEAADAEFEESAPPAQSRRGGGDPFFGYLIAMALAFGLMPLIPFNADFRYVLVWALLAFFGVMAWLFGTMTRIEREAPEDIAWGAIFGVMVGAPLLLVGGTTLGTTAQLMFTVGAPDAPVMLTAGAVFSLLIFTQPLAETLFFRGLLQGDRSLWLVGSLSSLWSVVLLLPMLNVGRYPVVAVIISVILVMINLIYSYVRQRNGLAAAWVCQMVVNFVVFFLPYLGS
ncbi:MAG: hypothetical protein L6Q98_04760 [Anaerolineae bacterium]|nr:hypothetical protein [Anaerolineae bacterium]NUQ03478.1 hypothetical protein [Anaerolineae bacterium]